MLQNQPWSQVVEQGLPVGRMLFIFGFKFADFGVLHS